MKHVRQVNIASYRGLSNIEIGGLADVNVFLGPSNSGKTSALEAMYLGWSVNEVDDAVTRIIRSRGAARAASVLSLFPSLNEDNQVDITLSRTYLRDGDHPNPTISGKETDRIRLIVRKARGQLAPLAEIVVQRGGNVDDCDFLDVRVHAKIGTTQSNPRFQLAFDLKKARAAGFMLESGELPDDLEKVRFVSPADLRDISVFDERYSNAYLAGTLPSLLDALRSVYPLLKDIRPVKVDADRWMSYVQIGSGVYPMFAMGDGFKAAMVLLSHALSPGLLLLDTPEAFQHIGGLEALSKSIAEAAGGLGSQVMIATQSLEFLDILLRDCEEREVSMSLVRFEHTDKGIVAFPTLSGQGAKDARELVGADLRL